MTTDLCESIRAGVVFESKTFRPVWFSLGKSKVVIKEIHYHWKEKKAEEIIHKFTVSDGDNFYEIQFSSKSMQWFLSAVG